MPPPTAMTTSERESPTWANRRQRPSTVSSVLFASPSPMVADLERHARVETVQPPGLLDGLLGHHDRPLGPVGHQAGQLVADAVADQDRVGTCAQRDLDLTHRLAPLRFRRRRRRATIRVATSSGLRSSTSMISSATSA